MYTIEIDFDVYKELTFRRSSEEINYNDVLRDLLKLPVKTKQHQPVQNKAQDWIAKRVVFPQGTDFRATYKGKIHHGKVINAALVVNGKKFSTPSAAACSVTQGSVNGWTFWECKRPNDRNWKRINELRKN